MGNLTYPRYKGWKRNGVNVAAGCYLYSYEAGGTTLKKTTYSDSDRLVANSNPIVLDANGEAPVFLGSGAYRFDLKTASGALINTFDGVPGRPDTLDSSETTIPTFPTTCPLGKTYFYGLPVSFDTGVFTLDNTQLHGSSTADTMIVGGSPVAYRNTDYSFAISVVRASGMITSHYEFTSFIATLNSHKVNRGINTGSANYAWIKISNGPIIKAGISGLSQFQYLVYAKDGVTVLYTSTPITVGTGTFTYTATNTFEIVRPNGTSGTFDIYFNGVLVVTYVEGTTGARTIYLESNYSNSSGDYDSGAANSNKNDGGWSNLYAIGDDLPNICLGTEALSTFVATLVGCTTEPTVTVKYTRFGDLVALIIPHMDATSNTTALGISGLPPELQPKTRQDIQGFDCLDDGNLYPATLIITNSSTMTIYRKPTHDGAPSGTFTNSGDKGMTTTPWTVIYSLV